MITIHKEGRLTVFLSALILMTGTVLSALFLSGIWEYLVYGFAVAVMVLVLRFFRVPRRRPFIEEKTIVAPADGRVVAIERVTPDEFILEACTQVSIFMSIHDVHINYYPMNGRVAYAKYSPGKYLVARHPKSSPLNERYTTGIETPYGPLMVRQIAGMVARRIRCYAREGAKAEKGREMGFIKFGSRVDLFVPPDASIQVKRGQKVTGSVTPVARYK